MSILLIILILLTLAMVFVQDMKHRAVSWILFPFLCVLFGINNFLNVRPDDFLFNLGMNMMMLVSVFFLVTLYFSLKNKKLVNVSKELIGWGDILFLICIAVLFSPLNFMIFFIISFLVISMVGGLMLLKKNDQIQIPLAGLQALMLMGVIGLDYLSPVFKINSDEWVLLWI